MPNARRAGLRLGKNPPKEMSPAERRRRAKVRRLKSTANAQKFRIDFMQRLIAAENRPARRAYFYEELQLAKEKRERALRELRQLQSMDLSVN